MVGRVRGVACSLLFEGFARKRIVSLLMLMTPLGRATWNANKVFNHLAAATKTLNTCAGRGSGGGVDGGECDGNGEQCRQEPQSRKCGWFGQGVGGWAAV